MGELLYWRRSIDNPSPRAARQQALGTLPKRPPSLATTNNKLQVSSPRMHCSLKTPITERPLVDPGPCVFRFQCPQRQSPDCARSLSTRRPPPPERKHFSDRRPHPSPLALRCTTRRVPVSQNRSAAWPMAGLQAAGFAATLVCLWPRWSSALGRRAQGVPDRTEPALPCLASLEPCSSLHPEVVESNAHDIRRQITRQSERLPC